MKLLSRKPLFIIGLALCFVVCAGIILLLKKQAPVQPQAKPYPHEHLQTSALEPLAKLRTVDYKVQPGETLAGIARLRYGHQNYYRVIKLYNHLDNEGELAADHPLRLPDMSVIVAEESLNNVAGLEMTLILCSRAKYDNVVGQLWAHHQSTTDNQLSEDVKRQLLEAAYDLQQAIASLKLARPGVNGVPAHMIGQLQDNMIGMRALAEDRHSDPEGYDIDMVQQRFALAFAYAIIWARDGALHN